MMLIYNSFIVKIIKLLEGLIMENIYMTAIKMIMIQEFIITMEKQILNWRILTIGIILKNIAISM